MLILFSLNSQAQQLYLLGESLDSVKIYYDSIVYQNTDTLVVQDDYMINFIAEDNIITHFIKILPFEMREIIDLAFNTMIKSEDKYFFEYYDGLYVMYILELMDEDYFGLVVGRVE